jgi:hypothetical protein
VRSDLDHALESLVALGIAEARRLEIALAAQRVDIDRKEESHQP